MSCLNIALRALSFWHNDVEPLLHLFPNPQKWSLYGYMCISVISCLYDDSSSDTRFHFSSIIYLQSK